MTSATPANPTANVQMLARPTPMKRCRTAKQAAPTPASGTNRMSEVNGSHPVCPELFHVAQPAMSAIATTQSATELQSTNNKNLATRIHLTSIKMHSSVRHFHQNPHVFRKFLSSPCERFGSGGINEINVEKANTSQTGNQTSQKYLPSVPLVIGTIEHTRKLRAENTPTT